jgi:ABC-2 type transport system ATP-binding protein
MTNDHETSSVILAEGLTKRYGKFTAVDNLDLAVQAGEVFGLLGPNGAGKTTTILMLLGLTEPSAGKITVAGHDPVRDPLAVKAVVGYLPDNVGFYPSLSGRQNLLYTASLNGIRRKEAEQRIDSLLGDVGLTDSADKRAGSYSRGMKQRLGIADALVKQPAILILDEPTIGIDPEGVRDLLMLIRRLTKDQGMTVLLSSHLLHQVQEVCDRVGVFVGGRLIASGPLAALEHQLSKNDQAETELRAAAADGAELPGAASGPGRTALVNELTGALAALPGVTSAQVEQDVWLIRSDRDMRVEVARLLTGRGLLPVHLRRRGLSLDDIYDRYFREEAEVTNVRK